ncbi:N-terminal protein methyltransferase [Aspergillus stella-maris]|uniref:N-terminal protein methyltransferase n=1 Tax=Aspergillus stella-maris TaxID=1810926 RepID=UPI003CCCF94A
MSSSNIAQDEGDQRLVQVDSNINPTASINYWNSVPATATSMLGMLGTYPWYTRIDLRGSRSFLAKTRRLIPGCSTEGKLHRAVDCGAGVGRVTEGFLRHVCDVVDAVEPVEKFTDVLCASEMKKTGVVGDVYTLGLEDWVPAEGRKYDLIWIQFCVGHLSDAQLLELLRRCRGALAETGMIVFKENMSTDPAGNDMYDEEDSSVTRTNEKFRALFEEAGMRVIISELQLGFPKNFKLLPVRFYALRPKV